jgi:hypothetical protein
MRLEKKLVKCFKDFQLVDLLGFAVILGVKEKEDFVEFVTDIIEAYSKRPYKEKISMLKLAKDVAGNNRDYDRGKRTLIKPVDDAATINVSNIMDEVSVSDTNGG